MSLMALFDAERIWWIVMTCVLTTIVGILISWLKSSIDSQRDERRRDKQEQKSHDKTMDGAMRYLLKDRILQACQHWQAKGFCPLHNREVLTEMVDAYHVLGGNSFVTEVYEETMSLPIKDAA